MSKVHYICKYTPVELLAAFGAECVNLNTEPAGFDRADALAHPNLCGFGKAVIEAVLAGDVRELVLVKVNATNKTRQDIMTICELMGAKVADISPTSLTLELSDTPDRVQVFEDMLRPFSIKALARTGVIALQKGSGNI